MIVAGKERFKVTIKDRTTGEKTAYYVHSAGFFINMRVSANKIDFVRMVFESPRKKIKERKNG